MPRQDQHNHDQTDRDADSANILQFLCVAIHKLIILHFQGDKTIEPRINTNDTNRDRGFNAAAWAADSRADKHKTPKIDQTL